MKAKNIQWDTDGDMEVLESLPTEMELPEGMEDIDEIEDWLSDETGFCHYGFELEGYFDIHVCHDKEKNEGYSIFVIAECKDDALVKAIRDELFTEKSDIGLVDNITEISEKEYRHATANVFKCAGDTKMYAVDVRFYIPAKSEEEAAEILEETGVMDSEYYSAYYVSDESVETEDEADEEQDNEADEKEEVTKEMIWMGLEKLIITIHNDICGCMGICCKIGDYAFYFLGNKDDQISIEEYWQLYTKDMTVEMIYNVLKNSNAAEENGIEEDEWEYYCTILNQMYKVENSEYRLVSLMDGTGMGDQTIIFKTNAPAEELKELERVSCEVYLNDGDYDDVPIWETVLNDKGYVFEYVDSSTNCGSDFLEHVYAYVTEHYVIDNQPDVK